MNANENTKGLLDEAMKEDGWEILSNEAGAREPLKRLTAWNGLYTPQRLSVFKLGNASAMLTRRTSS